MQAHGPPLPAARQARESMRRPSRRQRTRCGQRRGRRRRRGQSGAHPIESAACPLRRDGRVVECAGLEIRYTVIPYRGFESLSLRHSFQAGRIPLRHFKSPGKGLFCCLESGKKRPGGFARQVLPDGKTLHQHGWARDSLSCFALDGQLGGIWQLAHSKHSMLSSALRVKLFPEIDLDGFWL